MTSTRREAPSGERGQGLVEYGLIVALIAIVTLVALLFLSSQISSILSAIADQI